MKLTVNELFKHFRGRVMWLVMALLVVINVAFALRDGKDRYDPEMIDALKAAERIVNEHPDEIYESYQTMKEMKIAYDDAWYEWLENSMLGPYGDPALEEEPKSPEFPSTYYEGMSDYSFFDNYYKNVLTAEGYETLITEKRENARQTVFNYQNSGYPEDSYAFRSQVDFWILYGEALEQVHPDGTVSYGWDLYWQYDGTGLFLLLAAIFAGSRLFTVERDSGMDVIVRTSRRGRGQLALSKIGAAALWMLAASVVFHLSSLLTAAYQCGLSSPFAPVQQTSVMLYCPYPLSQLGAYLLTVLFSALAAWTVCLLAAGLTLLLKRALPAIAVTALLVGAEFILADGTNEFLKSVNLLTATSGYVLWSRWLPIHIFEAPVSILPIILTTLALLLLVAAMLCTERWVHRGLGMRTRRWNLPNLFEKLNLRRFLPKFRTVRLLPYEWHKAAGFRTVLICILLIVLQIALSMNTLNGELTFYDDMKLRYMEEYSDLSLVEAEAVISERLSTYAEATTDAKASEMSRLSIAGKITYEEYSAYCDLLNEALTHSRPLTEYRNELRYLIEKSDTLGVETRPVISTGFVNWMERPFDLFAVLFLFVLLSGIFAREHETKIYPILRTTVKGRAPVWFAKLRFVLFCSLIVALGTIAFDSVLLLSRYPTDYLTAPLVCISRYVNTESGITAGQYMMLICLLRVLGLVVWGLMIAALSELFRSEWVTAGCLLLLFLPYGLTLLGVTGAEMVDFTLLLSGDRLWLASTLIGGLGFLGIFALLVVAFAIALSVAGNRRYCI